MILMKYKRWSVRTLLFHVAQSFDHVDNTMTPNFFELATSVALTQNLTKKAARLQKIPVRFRESVTFLNISYLKLLGLVCDYQNIIILSRL